MIKLYASREPRKLYTQFFANVYLIVKSKKKETAIKNIHI